MDFSKATNNDRLALCRWYFRAGCFCLPFVWFVNTLWFFHDAFLRPEYAEQKAIRKLVIWSGVGTAVWVALIASWVTVYQSYRVSWGDFGDSISVVIPTGRA